MVNDSDRESWTKGLGYGEVKRSHSAKLEYKGSRIDLDVLFNVSTPLCFVIQMVISF